MLNTQYLGNSSALENKKFTLFVIPKVCRIGLQIFNIRVWASISLISNEFSIFFSSL